jgi:hypothetical protein
MVRAWDKPNSESHLVSCFAYVSSYNNRTDHVIYLGVVDRRGPVQGHALPGTRCH